MHPTPVRPRRHALRTGRGRIVLVAGIIATLAAVATGCGSAGAGEAAASPDLDAREAELNDREAELEQVEAERQAQETEEAEQRAEEAEARADEAEQRAEEAEEAREAEEADRATTTTTPQPPAAPVEVEVNVDAGPGDVVVAPARTPLDSDVIPAGVIEDGRHYGYVTDIEGWEFTFDRADVAADGSWTNNNSKLRTLPMSIAMWQGGDLVGGSPIEIEVRNQRVVSAFILTDSCGC